MMRASDNGLSNNGFAHDGLARDSVPHGGLTREGLTGSRLTPERLPDKGIPENYLPNIENSIGDTSAATNAGDAPIRNALRFDIGHLTLPWPTRYERAQFTQSLQAELERLTANYDSSVWSSIVATRLDRLDIGVTHANSSPQELGRKVAVGLIKKLAGPRGARTDG